MLDTNLIAINTDGFTSYLQTVYGEFYSRFSPQEWEDILSMASDYVDTYEAEQEALVQYDYGYEEGRDSGYEDGREWGYDEGFAEGKEEGLQEGYKDALDAIRELAENA